MSIKVGRYKQLHLENSRQKDDSKTRNGKIFCFGLSKRNHKNHTDKYKLTRHRRPGGASLSWFEDDIFDADLEHETSVQQCDNAELTAVVSKTEGESQQSLRISVDIEAEAFPSIDQESMQQNTEQGKQDLHKHKESVIDILRAAVEDSEFEYDIRDEPKSIEVVLPPLANGPAPCSITEPVQVCHSEELTHSQLNLINEKKQAAMALRRKMQRQNEQHWQRKVALQSIPPHSENPVDNGNSGSNGVKRGLTQAQLKRIDESRRQAILKKKQKGLDKVSKS